MKKTLLLMAMAVTSASAFAQTAANGYTEPGWYTIQGATGSAASALIGAYATNCDAEFMQRSGRWYALEYNTVEETSPLHYIYISRVGSTTNYNIRALNGHYINEQVLSFRSAVNVPITAAVRLGFWSNFDATSLSGPSNLIGGSSSTTNLWNIQPVDAEALGQYDIWTVSIEHAVDAAEIGNDVKVTLDNAENKGIATVYNGGHYFVTSGTTITTDQISVTTPSEMAGHNTPTITINAESKTITVNFAIVPEVVLANDLKEAAFLSNHKVLGLGDNSALKAAVDEFKSNPSDATQAAVATALATYTATSEAATPEDGKAYAFVNIHQVLDYNYFDVIKDAAGNDSIAIVSLDPVNGEIPASAYFVAGQKTDEDADHYVFVNDNGSYLVWRTTKSNASGNNYNDARGVVSDVAAVNNYIRITNTTGAYDSYYVAGKRNDDSNDNRRESAFILTDAGILDLAGIDNTFDNTTFSSHFAIVEVEYPHNTVTFKPLEQATPATERTGEPIDLTYSSIYLPFAVKLPVDSDVHAMAVSAVDDDTNALTLAEFGAEDGIIPANTAAILIKRNSNEETSEVLVPASAAGTAPAANLLVGHNGTAPEGEHSALSHDNGGFAASAEKPAYTALLAHTNLNEGSTATYSMTVPDDVATSITEVETVAPAAQAIYDLQGRRVARASKGIFIINGKKTLVK